MTFSSCPLSASPLWQAMKDYYIHRGLECWADDTVPSFITSNVFIGRQYAEVIVAAIEDTLARFGKITTPFYALEVGAGHGKLGFYVVRHVQALLKARQIDARFCYILTDIAPSTLEAWAQHPQLSQWIEQGWMDYALFDALENTHLTLRHQGITLQTHSLETPLFVLANYLFDTLPADCFQVQQGALQEIYIESHSRNPGLKTSDSTYLQNLEHRFSMHAVNAQDRYQEPLLQTLLARYQDIFSDSDATLHMPVGAFQALRTLSTFSQKGLVLLTADKGSMDLGSYAELSDPHIAEHGSVSLMVNFDAIAYFIKHHHGQTQTIQEEWENFQVMLGTLGVDYATPRMHFAFESIQSFGPSDYCHLVTEVHEALSEKRMTLPIAVSLLKLSYADPYVFSLLESFLENTLESSDDYDPQGLATTLARVLDNFFFLEAENDIPFTLGLMLYHLEAYTLAEKAFTLSLHHFDDKALAHYNLALCAQGRDELTLAMHALEQCLALDPHYEPALELRSELAEALT